LYAVNCLDVKPVVAFSPRDGGVRAPDASGPILIVRACAIGDLVLNLPALRALAERAPHARFTLVGYPENLKLARLFIPVEAIHSIEAPPWSSLFAHPLDSGALGSFDAAYVWMKDPTFADNLRKSGAKRVIHASAFPESGPAADHLLRTIELPAPELPDMWIPSDRVIIHPGSGSPTKCWPHFSELIETVPDAAVLRGPCEAGFKTPAPRLEGLALPQVAHELRRCRLFVGNDSGITHLAAYMGCPTVALFGPTDPRIWGPVGRRVDILWKSPLAGISLAEVRKFL